MTFNYTNRQCEEVKIGDKKEKIYVPFVMLTGMMLDNEKFTNVTVSNGKVLNDGSHTYVAGFALPGLKESLALGDGLDLPSSVEITADVEAMSIDAFESWLVARLATMQLQLIATAMPAISLQVSGTSSSRPPTMATIRRGQDSSPRR